MAASTCWWAITAARRCCCGTTPAQGNHWLGLKLEGVKCNRDAVGARSPGRRAASAHRLKNNGGSYLSSHDLREVLGAGKSAKIDTLEIHWPAPSKQVDRITNPPLNKYVRVVEGKGVVA